MEKIKQYILAGVSMLVGALLQYLYSLTEDLQIFTYVVSILILLGGLLCVILLQHGQRTLKVKYTVLVFVIDSKKRLLTIYNEYHKRLMIPCGVIPATLTPNEAVEKFLKEQAGLNRNDYTLAQIDTRKHIDSAELHPCEAQIEFITKHEKRVKLHYSFVYCLELTKPIKELSIKGDFKKFRDLQHMDSQTGLFSDLLERYRRFVWSEKDE